MTLTYEYTGDAPTVFTTLKDAAGHTWVPSKGDRIESAEGLAHPLLRLVVIDEPAVEEVPLEVDPIQEESAAPAKRVDDKKDLSAQTSSTV